MISFRTLCEDQLREMHVEGIGLEKRLDWELLAIHRTGSEHIFMTWYQMSRDVGIQPSEVFVRGTIGNLLVSYLVGITNYNPLEFHLSSCMAVGYDGMRPPVLAVSLPSRHFDQARQWLQTNRIVTENWDLTPRSDKVANLKETILEITKPRSIDELVKALSLSCGIGVWEDNAEMLLAQETADLSDVISNRDDVFDFLQHKGLGKAAAYRIAMLVCKGRLAHPLRRDDSIYAINLMRDIDVPDWYIESCKKIYYLFPRAYAISYAMLNGK